MSCRDRSCCEARPCTLCVPKRLPCCFPGPCRPSLCCCAAEDSDARPFERRCDRPFRNLNEVHHAGLEGLNAVFLPGTLWENGPFVEGQDPTVVRITAKGAYTQGVNYSTQPGAECAKGNPTWFIACEVVRSPFGRKQPIEGCPPHTLVPHRGCETCHSCHEGRACHNTTAGVLQSMRAEVETLQNEVARLSRHVDSGYANTAREAARAQKAERRANEAERKLAQAKRALA